MTHIDLDVDHIIKLHTDYLQAAQNLDSNVSLNIFRQSVNQNGMFTITEKKIKWTNYKQSTYDRQGNTLTTVPLAKYMYRFKTMSIPSVAILLVQQISNVQLPYHKGLILVVIPTSGINMPQLLPLSHYILS